MYNDNELYFDHYHGDIINGQRDGNGTFTFADGSFYSGIWRGNKPSGVGMFHYTDGKYDAGIYSVKQYITHRKDYCMDTVKHNTLMETYMKVTLRKEI